MTISFLESSTPQQGAEVFNQWIPRARFGLHIHLGQLSEQIDKLLAVKRSKQAANMMNQYFILAGLDASNLSGEQMLVAYNKLTELNALSWLLPFQTWQAPPDDSPTPPYQYSDRYIAWMCHKLASRYHWTLHYILEELYPEQVFFMLQEILISEYDEVDERRSLTELGYHYDRQTRRAVFRPVPRPSWMLPEKPKRVFKIKKSMLPVGHIIALGSNDSGAVH